MPPWLHAGSTRGEGTAVSPASPPPALALAQQALQAPPTSSFLTASKARLWEWK